MTQDTGISLVDRFADPHYSAMDPYEVAEEINELHAKQDISGLLKLRDAYVIGQGRQFPTQSPEEVTEMVDVNLFTASGLADVVNQSGEGEASGQMMFAPPHVGPVAQFYQDVTGYRR
jgi:hypothetical protein